MSTIRILLVHSDPHVLGLLRSMLQSLGQPIDEADSDRAAVKCLERGAANLVIAGVDPNDPDGLELLHYVRRKFGKIPVILLFSGAHPERCKEAMQRGAAAVLRLPIAANPLRAAVAQALGLVESDLAAVAGRSTPRVASATVAAPPSEANGGSWAHPANGHGSPSESLTASVLTDSGSSRGAGTQLLGEDPCLRHAIEFAESIAPTRAPVLILGERGTGKSLLARALHQQSLRREGPFVELSCAHMKESALEVELFGRKASYTDPLGDRPGRLAMAQGGTLYIDEVTALSPELQFKLLRLLHDGEYEPVGSTQTSRADVRIILGSRENLAAWVEQGRLRQDLYGRISVGSLKLPPLRLRGEDIVRLAEHFRHRFSRELGKPVLGFAPDALAAMRRHEWPGNVEELENTVERAVMLCRGPRIEADVLTRAITESAMPRPAPTTTRPQASRLIRPLKEALEEPEKRIILQALEALNWNRQETARMLDINRTTLYKKMKKYGLLFEEPVYLN